MHQKSVVCLLRTERLLNTKHKPLGRNHCSNAMGHNSCSRQHCGSYIISGRLLNTCCEIAYDVKGMVIQSFVHHQNKKLPAEDSLLCSGDSLQKSGHKRNYNHFPPSIKKGPIPFLAKTCSQIVPRPWPKPPSWMDADPNGGPRNGKSLYKPFFCRYGYIIPKNTMGTLLGVQCQLSLEWGHLDILFYIKSIHMSHEKKS